MSCDGAECDHEWHYESPRTPAGALQHGLGRGAREAAADPAAPDLVMNCVRRDYRWDWQVDERAVYLARLVRDLRLPIDPIAAQLFSAPWEEFDKDNAFAVSLGVLEVLARSGADTAVDAITRYVGEGGGWLCAVETVATSWPVEWWDGLYSVVRARLDAAEGERPHWRSLPWTRWAERDDRIAAEVQAFLDRPRPEHRFADVPVATLLGLLREPGRNADRRSVLAELRRRPPDPLLLDLVEDLSSDDLHTADLIGLAGQVERLGPLALPAARRWAAVPEHRLRWTAFRLLAAYGDDADTARLIAGLDWLDESPGDLCGYGELVAGLARIGGTRAAALLPRVRALWLSPHSYERAAYLDALVRLDPTGLPRQLFEGLWDCEADVRKLAAERVPLIDRTRERLCYLRDDPIETDEVRTIAAARLN